MELARALSIAMLAGLAIACKPKRPRGPPASTFQVVAVDDRIDPFASVSRPADVEVERDVDDLFAQTRVHDGESEAAARARLRAWLATVPLPPGERFAIEVVHDERDGASARTRVLSGAAIVATGDLVDAQVAKSDVGPVVTVTLSRDGARRFGDFTSASVGRRVAILVDDDVECVARIMSPILLGHLQIPTRRGDAQAAEHLAAALRPR